VALPETYLPVCKQLIGYARSGFNLLDKLSQGQVIGFIQSRQHKNGGFVGRGEEADIYYTLFGVWLFEATGMKLNPSDQIDFCERAKKQERNAADKFALILIKSVLFKERYRKPSLFSLLSILAKHLRSTGVSYSLFLFLLTYDTFYRTNRVLKFIIRIWLRFFRIYKESPCSMVSAVAIARHQAGLKTEKEVQLLMSYYVEGKGFRLFGHLPSGDLLSTAVSLFALKTAGFDLRLIAPGCLNFIQENFDNGAFLSGDGDQHRDLEYTFYGLLALGTLA
jgi:hypothetical protein